jgi:hypothetical protein
MIIAVGCYTASLMQDLSVSLGTFGCVGHSSNRDGQHTHAVLPRKRSRPGSTTLDGSRGGWLWTDRLSSARCGAAGAMQGRVAASGAALPALVYAAEVGAMR